MTRREIIVGIEESASYVEDMWPDEVEYLIRQAASLDRDELRKAVERIVVGEKTYNVDVNQERLRILKALALLSAGDKAEAPRDE